MASPQTVAQRAAATLLDVARRAGWERARFSILPDGTLQVDASMAAETESDEFLNPNLRVAK